MSTAALELENLSKSYGSRNAVDKLSLEVNPGDVYGFLGPNGAGKSTTIRMIFGLIKPNAGDVRLFGETLKPSNRKMLANVGGLIESPDFYQYMSARKNLEILGKLHRGFDFSGIDESLEIVGLADRADDKVKTYSHGMKQRLGIAQALMTKPKLLVLDEPTTGLDPKGMVEVRELIKHLAESEGMAVFLSSHLLGEIEQTATHVGVINRGELIIQDRLEDLLNSGERTVTIEVTDAERAAKELGALPFVKEVEVTDNVIRASAPPEMVSELNRRLVESGYEVSSLIPRTPLEEYFLAITGEESDA